jgi:hypothetical protein
MLLAQPFQNVIGNGEGHVSIPDDAGMPFAGKISDARHGWIDDRSMVRVVDMDLWKRQDGR